MKTDTCGYVCVFYFLRCHHANTNKNKVFVCLFFFSLSPFLSFGVHSLPISQALITTSSSVFLSSQYGFSNFLTYVCHTCSCSYFLCPYILNPLYSHQLKFSSLFFLVSPAQLSSMSRSLRSRQIKHLPESSC